MIHISLNPSPDDTLTPGQHLFLANEFMRRFGYGEQPYAVFLHKDVEREHVHIVSVRIDEQGWKLDDRFEIKRAIAICREMEQEYGLNAVAVKEREVKPALTPIEYGECDLKHKLEATVSGGCERVAVYEHRGV